MTKRSPFKDFKTSPEVIRLAVMMQVRYPLSLRNVEDLLHERGIEISHETVRFWWNRLGPMFAAEIRRKRVGRLRTLPHWRQHLDEVFVKINGVTHYLWRAGDQEGEVLEALVTKRRDRKAALKQLRKTMKRARHCFLATAAGDVIVTRLDHKHGEPVFCVERAKWWQNAAITLVTLSYRRGYHMTTRY